MPRACGATRIPALVVLNPSAGGGRAPRRLERLRGWVERWAPGHEIRRTEGPGHAEALARECAGAGTRLVIVAGGDGTVGEVANGLLDAEAAVTPKLAVLPLGTGCDFARSLGLPRSPAALRRVRPRWRAIDIGVAVSGGRRRHFVNAVNVGLGALVARRLGERPRLRRLGRLAYLLIAVPVLRSACALPLSMTVDGIVEQADLLNLVVCNGSYLGGGMSPCPDARLDDGRLDVACVAPMSAATVTRLGWSVLLRRPLRGSAIRVTRGRSIRIEGDAAVELDGDPWGELPVEFGLLPAAIEVMTPAAD